MIIYVRAELAVSHFRYSYPLHLLNQQTERVGLVHDESGGDSASEPRTVS